MTIMSWDSRYFRWIREAVVSVALMSFPMQPYSFPCLAFCANGIINGNIAGDIIDEYISTPSIDHLDQTLKARAEQVTEEARKVLNKMLSEKLADLDAIVKQNIELAYSKMQDLMKDFFTEITKIRDESIVKMDETLTKQRGGLAADMAEFSNAFIPSLIAVAAVSAIIGVLAVYLIRQRMEKSEAFPLAAYAKASLALGAAGAIFALGAILFMKMVDDRSNTRKMMAYLDNQDFLEASFYARLLARADPDDVIRGANVDRILLFRDAFYKPVRGHADAIDDLEGRARDLTWKIWTESKGQKADRSSLALIALLRWTNDKSRNSEYVAARIAAHVLLLPKNQWPLDSELDASMKAIVANYSIAPLDNAEVALANEDFENLIKSLPLTFDELSKSNPETMAVDTASVTSVIRKLTLETINIYYYAVESLARQRKGMSSASFDHVNVAIEGVFGKWRNFFSSQKYLKSTKTEKIFLLKVPLAVLSRLMDYNVAIKQNRINENVSVSCANYDGELDKRGELKRLSDRSIRTVAGVLPAPANINEVIAGITYDLERGPDKDKVPSLSLLALRTAATSQAEQLTKELYDTEQDYVLAMSDGMTVIDCLRALPKKMKCGVYIQNDIESAPCPDDDPNATTSDCVTSILGVAHAVYSPATCPDTSIRKITSSEAKLRLKRAVQGLAGLGVITCAKSSHVPYDSDPPDCSKLEYRTPAYRLALERYGKDLTADSSLDADYSEVSLLPTS